jgi:CspA family cold shock protein
MEGTVKFFNRNGKGWGFIKPDDGPDVFCHLSGLLVSTLEAGDRVSFEIGKARDGRPLAVQVDVLESEANHEQKYS